MRRKYHPFKHTNHLHMGGISSGVMVLWGWRSSEVMALWGWQSSGGGGPLPSGHLTFLPPRESSHVLPHGVSEGCRQSQNPGSGSGWGAASVAFPTCRGAPGSARVSGCGSALPQSGKCGPGASRACFRGKQSERRGMGSSCLGLSGIRQWLGETVE